MTDKQIANFLKDAKRCDWVPTAIDLTTQGESIDLIDRLRASGDSQLIMMLNRMTKADISTVKLQSST